MELTVGTSARTPARSLGILAITAALTAGAWLAGPVALAQGGPPFHCNQANMHPNQLLVGQVGVPYADTISITPANANFYHQWSMSPSLVAGGLSLVPNPNNTFNDATIQGTPTTAGTWQVTVTGGGTYVLGTICRVTKTFTLTVTP